MRLNIQNLTGTLLVAAIVAFFTVGCQKRSTLPNFGQINTPNQFNPDLQGQFPGGNNNIPGLDFDDDPITNPGGFDDLGPAETQGLGNLLRELELTNPQNETALPPELAAELEAALKGAGGNVADPQVAFQKIALAGKVLTACLASVEDYVPRPGEPLQGDYDGSCGGKKMPLTIEAIYQKIFRRRPSSGNQNTGTQDPQFNNPTPSDTQNHGFANGIGLGNVKFRVKLEGVQGIMNVNQNGIGAITVGKYKGNATDIPGNGKPAPRAELSRPDEGSGKHLVAGCKGDWVLTVSRNPIPEKYVEAMKKVGQCYRKAAILFTPGFDKLFANMDPQLRQVIQLKLLGIQ